MSAPHVRHADSSKPRPRRLWYRVGAVVIALAVFAGVAGSVFALTRTPALPDFVAEVRGPGEATFTVDEGFGRLGLYSSPAGADGSACAVVLPDGGVRAFDQPPYGRSVESGEWGWSLVGQARPDRAGEYTLVCDGDPEALYALGGLRDGGRSFALEMAGAMAWIILVPLVGLAFGGAVLLVTGTRRGSHERRPSAERTPPPPGHR